jgi:hypothetical protein
MSTYRIHFALPTDDAFSLSPDLVEATSGPRAVAEWRSRRTVRATLEAYPVEVSAEPDLGASEIACAVADAWAGTPTIAQREGLGGMSPEFMAALDRLEAVTRPSALRKVSSDVAFVQNGRGVPWTEVTTEDLRVTLTRRIDTPQRLACAEAEWLRRFGKG